MSLLFLDRAIELRAELTLVARYGSASDICAKASAFQECVTAMSPGERAIYRIEREGEATLERLGRRAAMRDCEVQS